MTNGHFFERRTAQSQIKSTIVAKYLTAWANIMMAKNQHRKDRRIAYIDLFCGPGRYEDGSESTPLEVLREAIASPGMKRNLVTIFNDKNSEFVQALQSEVALLSGVDQLGHSPGFSTFEVDRTISYELGNQSLIPSLVFVDPWGYKGLALDLIENILKHWGCEVIFFFNYNRVNLGINNHLVEEYMSQLFGPKLLPQLQKDLVMANPEQRQSRIIEGITNAIRSSGGRYIAMFEFKGSKGQRTSHYIIFASKKFIGYHVMKDIMFKESSGVGDVREFHYTPLTVHQAHLLLEPEKTYSIAALKLLLTRSCKGQTGSVWQFYESHSVDTPYTLRNFQDAMLQLEVEKRLTVLGSSKRPRKNGNLTLGKDRQVTFNP